MDLKTLQDTPPWDWPRDAGKKFQEILVDHQANDTDRLIAAELARSYRHQRRVGRCLNGNHTPS